MSHQIEQSFTADCDETCEVSPIVFYYKYQINETTNKTLRKS